MTPASVNEQTLRTQLGACYRIFAMLGWTELIYSHITVRVPGPERYVLIKINLQGRIVGDSDWPVNQAGLSSDNFYGAQLHGRVTHHDFEGITVHAEEGPCVVRSIGKDLAGLGPTVPVSADVQRKCSADALQFDPRHGGGREVFDALTRLVDRVNTCCHQ